MGATENRRPRRGLVRVSELVLDGALAVSALASSVLPIVLALAHLAQPVALFLAAVIALTGTAQRLRARARLRDPKYLHHPKILSLIRFEAAIARLWIGAGVALAGLCLLLAYPPLVAAVGAPLAAFAFLKGIGSAGRSAEAEVERMLSKGSAAEKCWRVQRWAGWASSARLVPGTKCFYRLAHYAVPAGQIGPMHAAALAAVGLCFFAYVALGLASVGTEIAGVHGQARAGEQRKADPPAPEVELLPHEGNPPTISLPTYAESCPEQPDPLKIKHGLGELFRHDGAAKAGCGGHARLVSGTGAWVAPGSCAMLHEMRSVAVSSPGQTPVILYGEPAHFAWAAALEGRLIGAEAARPAGGEVDIVETREGNYAFARQSPSLVRGAENLRWCWEVTGIARPFERLTPPLAWLWMESIRERRSWSWPLADPSDWQDPVSFVDHLTGTPVARGGCESEASCHLSIGNEYWPYEGTAFVSLFELEPYMPKRVE
jgi:hypothetical protein